jgi:hypothetical protein
MSSFARVELLHLRDRGASQDATPVERQRLFVEVEHRRRKVERVGNEHRALRDAGMALEELQWRGVIGVVTLPFRVAVQIPRRAG